MSYVDGYVLALPAKKLAAYKKMAKMGAKTWMKHGALEYRECVGDDLAPQWGVPFGKMMKLKRGETVVFAWVTFKSRAHRDRVNAAVMKELMSSDMDPADMPADMKRMVYGGFKTLVKG